MLVVSLDVFENEGSDQRTGIGEGRKSLDEELAVIYQVDMREIETRSFETQVSGGCE